LEKQALKTTKIEKQKNEIALNDEYRAKQISNPLICTIRKINIKV
jgi:hypothetical protein